MTNHLKRMRPHYFSISSPSTLNKKVARRHFADVMRQTRLGRLGLLPKDCYHYFSVLKSDSFLFDHEPEVIRGPFNAFFVLFFYFQKLMWMAPFLKPINKFIFDQKSIPWKKNTLTTCLSRDRKRTVSQFYWRRNPCQKLKGCNQLSYLFIIQVRLFRSFLQLVFAELDGSGRKGITASVFAIKNVLFEYVFISF